MVFGKRITNMTKIIALCGSVWLICGISFGTTIEFSKDGFVLTIPSNWIEIPQKQVAIKAALLSSTYPNAPHESIDHAFQPKSNARWFDYPYIIVQIKNTGRVTEKQLKELNRFSFDSTKGKIEKQLNDQMSKSQMAAFTYDVAHKIIWSELTANVQNEGKMYSLVGAVLTANGSISFYCSCRYTTMKRYYYVFQDIIYSVAISEQLKYK
jgi:hypothetical protein